MRFARHLIIPGALVAFLFVVVAGVVGWHEAESHRAGSAWQEIPWPFSRDAFPAGKAFRKGDLRLYVRPKLGFCGNCETGVVEDSEVDRVTDLDLLDVNFTPLKEGSRVRLADLPGRARLYRLKGANGRVVVAEAIAAASKCDLVVALIVGDQLANDALRQDAHDLIQSRPVQAWLDGILQGR